MQCERLSKLKFDWDSRRRVSEPRAGEGGGPSPGARVANPTSSAGARAERRSLYAASTGAAGAANYLCCVRLDVPTYITICNCYVRGPI